MIKYFLFFIYLTYLSTQSKALNLEGSGISTNTKCATWESMHGDSTPLDNILERSRRGVCIHLTKVDKYKVNTFVPKECIVDKFCNEIHIDITNKTKNKNYVRELATKLLRIYV